MALIGTGLLCNHMVTCKRQETQARTGIRAEHSGMAQGGGALQEAKALPQWDPPAVQIGRLHLMQRTQAWVGAGAFCPFTMTASAVKERCED